MALLFYRKTAVMKLVWLIVTIFFYTDIIFTMQVHAFNGKTNTKLHIVFVLADDLGFSDIGYNAVKYGTDIRTPSLYSSAMEGIRLENYYVQGICTPSRSQLVSGRYQIHTGLQHRVIYPLQPNRLPLDNILLPEQLQQCGYGAHMIGIWHIGFHKKEYTPWNRSFDTFSYTDYYTRVVCGMRFTCGFDQHSEKGPDNSTQGEYGAHLYVRKAKEIIDAHDKTKPMFLYLELQSVHSPSYKFLNLIPNHTLT